MSLAQINVPISNKTFEKKRLNSYEFNNVEIADTSFKESDLDLFYFIKTKIKNMYFYDSDLDRFLFQESRLNRFIIDDCVVNNSEFAESILEDVIFVNSYFKNISLTSKFLAFEIRECTLEGNCSIISTDINEKSYMALDNVKALEINLHVYMSGGYLVHCNFDGSLLNGTKLEQIVPFKNTTFRNCRSTDKFTISNCPEIIECSFNKTSFRYLILKNCGFSNVNFGNLKIDRGDFYDCIFENTIFDNMLFRNGDIAHSVFEGDMILDVEFNDVRINSSVFTKLEINSTIFSGVEFVECEFSQVKFVETKIVYCKFVGCTFRDCWIHPDNNDINNTFVYDTVYNNSFVITNNIFRENIFDGTHIRNNIERGVISTRRSRRAPRRSRRAPRRSRHAPLERSISPPPELIMPDFSRNHLRQLPSATEVQALIPLVGIQVNEKNVDFSKSCFDFITLEKLPMYEALESPDFVVFVTPNGKPFCQRFEDINTILQDHNNWMVNCDRDDIVYLKTTISPAGGIGMIQIGHVLDLLENKYNIVHLKKEKTISRTQGYLLRRGEFVDIGTYHCQEGSNLDVYSLNNCSGNDCIEIETAVRAAKTARTARKARKAGRQ